MGKPVDPTLPERVLCAAILYKDAAGGPHVVAGYRHNDIIIARHALHQLPTRSCPQGFLTSHGRFVSRDEAHQIAWEQGQTSVPYPGIREFCSEDLY